MDMHRFDALVIGAGMAGATAAAHLASTHRVAILEAEESAGYHTTGRSAAIWILNYGNTDTRILTGASRAFFESPPEGFGTLAQPRAILSLAPEDQLDAMAQMQRIGMGLTEISVGEARELVPAIRADYAKAALIERDAFDMDVAALHQGFLRQARQNGELALRRRAGRVWREGGEWCAETTGGDVFRAPLIVNAAGAWGDEVARNAGVRPLGLQPKRRTACIIDPAPFSATDWPLVGDVAHSWYARPEARSKLMVSPADETDSEATDAQPDEYDVAIGVDRMQQGLEIEVRRIEHKWAGLRTFAPDRSLCIGEGSEAGFFWMCGQGGYGIQTAPAAGRLLAALARGQAPEADIAAAVPLVDPARFA